MSSKNRCRLAVFVAVTMGAMFLPTTAWAEAPSIATGLTATPGNAQVALAWTVPSDTGGGGGIDTYHVEYSVDALAWSRVVRANSTAVAYTVTGLTNGTTYQFRVSAVNDADIGPWSATASGAPVASFSATDLATFSACPTAAIPAAGFTDSTLSEVNCIAYYGITKGTTATTYSPLDPVTRWQMALFLTRMATRAGITLGDGSDQSFTDIGGYSAEIRTAINQIKQLGITVGKTATTYAPADNVLRSELALFLTRLLKKATAGPGGNEEYVSGTSGPKEIKSLITNHNFTDINQGTYETRDAVVNLWNLGVTDSQALTTYEPNTVMDRRAMARFMANALAHTNARPKGLLLQASSYWMQTGSTVKLSVTHRADDFSAITGSSVDTFRFNYSTVSTVIRFDQSSNTLIVGTCTTYITATTVGNVKCTVDTADPKTDANGNLAVFQEIPPTVNKVDVWAWTATPTATYDNDVNATAASKVTVETHS
jgi:hypothetical protein